MGKNRGLLVHPPDLFRACDRWLILTLPTSDLGVFSPPGEAGDCRSLLDGPKRGGRRDFPDSQTPKGSPNLAWNTPRCRTTWRTGRAPRRERRRAPRRRLVVLDREEGRRIWAPQRVDSLLDPATLSSCMEPPVALSAGSGGTGRSASAVDITCFGLRGGGGGRSMSWVYPWEVLDGGLRSI